MTVGKRARALGMAAALIALAGCGGVVAGDTDGGSAEAAPTANTGDGSTDGITVHGQWRLDVMNADGTLDQTVEFENALQLSGIDTLTSLLRGSASAGLWGIALDGASGDGPCTVSAIRVGCLIAEPDVVLNDPSALGITLGGTVPIQNQSTITVVRTHLGLCNGTVAPSSCDAQPQADFPFTAKLASADLADDFEPIPVTAGQIVQVTVVISFS